MLLLPVVPPEELFVPVSPDVLLVAVGDADNCCVVGIAADRVVTVGVVGLDKYTLTSVSGLCTVQY